MKPMHPMWVEFFKAALAGMCADSDVTTKTAAAYAAEAADSACAEYDRRATQSAPAENQ